MTTGENDALRTLELAVAKLARSISKMDIDVFVPLYANTFPLATVAKRAAAAASKSSVSLKCFDWNWSKQGEDPPFLSSKPHQLFFATESEFPLIHAAGISFFAIPVSVFHPRYIFLGLPPKATPNDVDVVALKDWIAAALVPSGSVSPPGLTPKQAFALTWVSDIPGQALLLARAVESRRETPHRTPDGLVKIWRDRSLEDALGVGPPPKDPRPMVKAFIWGGPLASVAQKDAEVPTTVTATSTSQHRGWLRLRDPSRASVSIRLPSLSEAFSAQQIRREHALYCCVGYKETRRLKDYYMGEHHLKDVPWSLEGRKFAAMRGSEIPKLVLEMKALFDGIFAAATVAAARTQRNGGVLPVGKVFEEFKADYDKFCRTLNPVAQLYTAEEYVKCLYDHHDAEAFAALFPDRTATAGP